MRVGEGLDQFASGVGGDVGGREFGNGWFGKEFESLGNSKALGVGEIRLMTR